MNSVSSRRNNTEKQRISVFVPEVLEQNDYSEIRNVHQNVPDKLFELFYQEKRDDLKIQIIKNKYWIMCLR